MLGVKIKMLIFFFSLSPDYTSERLQILWAQQEKKSVFFKTIINAKIKVFQE